MTKVVEGKVSYVCTLSKPVPRLSEGYISDGEGVVAGGLNRQPPPPTPLTDFLKHCLSSPTGGHLSP